MVNTKVIYQYGNNNKFDYYIIDTNDNVVEEEIGNNALANIFKKNSGKTKLFRNSKIPTGNFELVLKITDKSQNFIGLTLADRNEIK